MDNELKYVSSEYIILGGSGNGGALALLFGLVRLLFKNIGTDESEFK